MCVCVVTMWCVSVCGAGARRTRSSWRSDGKRKARCYAVRDAEGMEVKCCAVLCWHVQAPGAPEAPGAPMVCVCVLL
jgi:hypothetical protein